MHAKLNDQDLMQLLLSDHKASAQHMLMCVLECANDALRTDCQNILNKTLDHQKQIWQAMNQRGWYQVQAATVQELARVQNQINQATQQLQMQ